MFKQTLQELDKLSLHRESITDYISTFISYKLNRVIYDKSNFVLRSFDMLETESYLPIIKNLAEKLKEQDAEIRILSILLSKLKFVMLVLDPKGNIIYTNKKDADYTGIKCWDFLHDREKQCNDCYFNPIGDKSGIGLSPIGLK